MQLNYDCIRDVLLFLEQNLKISDDLFFESVEFDELLQSSTLATYTKQDIFYSVLNLSEIEFIDATILWAEGSAHHISINNITYEGHEFLSAIRPPNVWQGIKSKLKTVGTISISLISDIAVNFISSRL